MMVSILCCHLDEIVQTINVSLIQLMQALDCEQQAATLCPALLEQQ